jgi:hypothetical protein
MEFETAANLIKIGCAVDPMNMAGVTMSPCRFPKSQLFQRFMA